MRHAATGALGRTFTTSALCTGAVSMAGGILYALDLVGTVHAINMSTGTSLWSTSVFQGEQQPAGTGLIRDGDTLYLGAITGGTTFYSTPTVANGPVFVGAQDNNLYAIRA